ncbi:MAG TPA: ATP-binding cassette domain-containing protein [Acidimicrobiales bacterium]|nr:ATP-binding cassette domain-containing protein [Acidimicrobiales bacterium]
MRLEARGIEFAYGTVQVLFGIDLTVNDGQVVALLGTNGSGKSTLLEVLAGLSRPTAGTIALAGEDVTGADAKEMVRRGVVLIQGGRAVFGDLTVMENLLVGLHSLRLGASDARRRVLQVIERFPLLHDLRTRRAATLSGGEQQHLAIAKGLLVDPQLLLVDELSLGLAPQAREETVALLRVVLDTGTSAVLVEQSLDAAASLCDHAVFMEKGEVKFDGPTATLLRSDLARAVFLGAPR